MPRGPRPAHKPAHLVHVTLRGRPEVGHLRLARVSPHLRAAIAAASTPRFRVCHCSVRRDHVHLLVEADGREALTRGVQGLAIRLARAVNRAGGRRGAVGADRYHARALATPREVRHALIEVRHALIHVLTNWKRHRAVAQPLDRCSSGPWFDGWAERPAAPPGRLACPVRPPETWLLPRRLEAPRADPGRGAPREGEGR